MSAIANHTAHQQIRIVESGAVSVNNGVSQFSAFMNRAWRLRCDMACNTSRE